jgi:hypothetical protein
MDEALSDSVAPSARLRAALARSFAADSGAVGVRERELAERLAAVLGAEAFACDAQGRERDSACFDGLSMTVPRAVLRQAQHDTDEPGRHAVLRQAQHDRTRGAA